MAKKQRTDPEPALHGLTGAKRCADEIAELRESINGRSKS